MGFLCLRSDGRNERLARCEKKKKAENLSSFTVKFISFTLMVHDIVEYNLPSEKVMRVAPPSRKQLIRIKTVDGERNLPVMIGGSTTVDGPKNDGISPDVVTGVFRSPVCWC